MLIGYMRVSKNNGSQTLDLQRDALIAAGINEERIYHDYVSSKKDSRPGLEACFKALQPENTLIVWKLDRLGRSLKELVIMIDELRQRQVGFKVLAGHGAQIDTTTPNGRLVFGLFAALAEFERELIVERTNAGLAAARARGRMGGRPRKVDTAMLKIAAAAMSDPKSIAAEVANRLNITTATLYTYVNSDGSLKKAGIKLIEGGVHLNKQH
jgi:DNA invertase Pin-like site-specific DNA recombinase